MRVLSDRPASKPRPLAIEASRRAAAAAPTRSAWGLISLSIAAGLVFWTSRALPQEAKAPANPPGGTKDAATEFIFNMLQGTDSKNQVFLQTFDSTSSIIQDFTNDPQGLNEKVRGLKAGGGKALYDAIFFACQEKMLKLGQPENMRRVLVVVSDGLDFHSEHTLDEAVSMARRAETVIYTIGNAAYGYDNPGDKVMSRLSEETGGAAYFPLEVSP